MPERVAVTPLECGVYPPGTGSSGVACEGCSCVLQAGGGRAWGALPGSAGGRLQLPQELHLCWQRRREPEMPAKRTGLGLFSLPSIKSFPGFLCNVCVFDSLNGNHTPPVLSSQAD